MKKFILFILFTLCSFVYCKETAPPPNLPNFVVLSMPKAGAPLLFKAIYRMTGLHPTHVQENEDVDLEDPYVCHSYPWKYLGIPFHQMQKDLKNKKLKKILIIRDLRDVALSQVLHTEYQLPGSWLNELNHHVYEQQSFSKKLIFFMVQNTHYLSSPKTIAEQILKFTSFKNTHVYKNVLVCRFENLVGPQGGGTSTLQKKELEKIAQFLNCPLTPFEIEKIAETLFGVEEFLDQNWQKQYYRSGRIGGWKQFFNADVLEYYDQNLKFYNQKLGYR